MGLLDRISGFFDRGPARAGLAGAEIGRARVVEHTPWNDISAGGANAGAVRHAILRDENGYHARLEDDLLGPRDYAAGPFASLEAARAETRRSVQDMSAAVAQRARREAEAPGHDSREVVEETPWQSLGKGAASIRHVITRDEAGHYVQREDDDEWHPVPPVGPFVELRDARAEAEADFEDLQASLRRYEAEIREPAPEADRGDERETYIPTPQERAEIEAAEAAYEKQDQDEREGRRADSHVNHEAVEAEMRFCPPRRDRDDEGHGL